MSRLIIKNCPVLKRDAVISWFQDPAKITAASGRNPKTPKQACNDGADRYDSAYYTGHSGLDFPGNRGDKIYAAHAGKVWIGQQPAGKWADGSAYGATTYVVIIRGNGIEESYCHMDTTLVTSGQRVAAGQQIGTMGDKGKAQGVHLHYHAYRNDKGLDAYAAMLGLYDTDPDGLMQSWTPTASKVTAAMPTGGTSVPDKEQYYKFSGGSWPNFTAGEYEALVTRNLYDKAGGARRVSGLKKGERIVVDQIITAGVPGVWGRTKFGYVQLGGTDSSGQYRVVWAWRTGGVPAGWAFKQNW